MSGLTVRLSDLKLSGDASVLHRPGSIRLDDYPLLTYALEQHGPGVRLEDNGTPVADIAAAVAETPSYEALAKRFHTTPEHIEQAIRYAVSAGVLAD